MTTPYRDVAHLLRRAGFGGLPNEISALAQFDLADVVDKVLDRSQVPAVSMPAGLLTSSVDTAWQLFVRWWCDRMASTPNPLAEKMALFWHGHFTSSLTKTDMLNMWNQINTLRDLGMGNFTALTQAVAISPAMLQWLDGAGNLKAAPNENFARESMELFTVGVNQYTQADVVAAARAWTGHGISSDQHSYVFDASQHDTGLKTFMGVTKNWNGPDIIDELCTGSTQTIAARFISTKVWSYFAYSNPESIVVDALAAAFISSNMDITALLRTIFLRPEFYSAKSRSGHVRNPTEFSVAQMRYTGCDSAHIYPETYLQQMGQYLLRPPNVAGWGVNEYWLSTSSAWSRLNSANQTWYLAKVNNNFLGTTSSVSIQTAAQRVFDAFGIEEPSASSRIAVENAIYASRLNNYGSEQQLVIQLGILCPEFQAG